MSRAELIVRGRRVLTATGLRPAAVHVADGSILAVESFDAPLPDAEVIDAGDLVVLPGLVDSHVHVNEPGRTAWEGFATATHAAALAGVTTIVDMPLNCIPPTTTVGNLERKRAAAAGKMHVDVAFWGGIVPGNADELPGLAAAGVCGFKAFLVDSGVDEFPPVTADELTHAMRVLRPTGLPVIVHAEDARVIADAGAAFDGSDRESYATYLASRPDEAERAAVETVVGLVRATQTRAHVVHVSSIAALDPLRAAHRDGLAVTAETCPHYLTLAGEAIADGATVCKCAPPIRGAGNREGLWRALVDGDIDMVVSDHSPSPDELKTRGGGDFAQAWGGISSLQLGLAAVWTGARARGIPIARVVEWMAAAPARRAGLADRKGAIAVGCDADLVVWDPEAQFTVRGAELAHRHRLTPYEGMALRGRVATTVLRGTVVVRDGALVGPPAGRLQPREVAT